MGTILHIASYPGPSHPDGKARLHSTRTILFMHDLMGGEGIEGEITVSCYMKALS